MENSIYAGAFSLMAGTCDFKIDFKSSEPICDETGKPVSMEISTIARVTMPLPLAKDMLNALQISIDSYEKTFGKIVSGNELNEIAQNNRSNG